MRQGSLHLVCLLMLLLLLTPTLLVADERTQNFESRIIETFDADTRTTDWLVRGSKFVTEGFPKKAYVQTWPDSLFGADPENTELEVLGAHFKFDRRGYNKIEFIPVNENEEGETVHNPIPMPGRVQQIDFWVWGSDFDYYMVIHLRDYRGVVHALDMGGLDFVGWRNLSRDIPSYIPREQAYAPYLAAMYLEKIVLWTKPHERVHNSYVYIDQIKVLTDIFITRFDGDKLAQPERVQEIWESEGE